jgi:TPR repeat protein
MVDIRILKTIVFAMAVVVALAMAFALPAAASFADGQTAYSRGAYTVAANIWRPMAEEGDVWAQHALAHLYEKGWGVEKDTAQARDWYRAAAERGNSDSMVNLGALYVDAEEGDRDLARAYTWFRLAALQGQPLALFNMTSIEMELTEADRLRSTQLAMAILTRLAANMDDAEKKEMRGQITEFLSSSTGRRTVALLNSARRKSQYYEAARDARGELPRLTMIETVGSAGPNEGAVQQN